MATKPTTFTVKMAFDRATKGTLRYNEVDDEGKVKDWGLKIGQLYVKKEAFQGAQPAAIEITLTTR